MKDRMFVMLAGLLVLAWSAGARAETGPDLTAVQAEAGTLRMADQGGQPRSIAGDIPGHAVAATKAPRPAASPSSGQDNKNLAMGNPTGATPNTADAQNYLITKPQFVLSYNNITHVPNWASWHVNSTWVPESGGSGRNDSFRPDDDWAKLGLDKAGWVAVTKGDYDNTGFDRGHMCNSKDRTNSVENNKATFVMTNMVPQSKKNNEQTWMHLEAETRKWIKADDDSELFIVAGPAGSGGESAEKSPKNVVKDPKTGKIVAISMIRGGKPVGAIKIPSCTWKVIVELPHGVTDPKAVKYADIKTIAVIMPNTQSLDPDWSKYLVSISQVEAIKTTYSGKPLSIFSDLFSRFSADEVATIKDVNKSASPTQCP